MRKNVLLAAILLLSASANGIAQDKQPEGYVFTSIKEIPTTSIKNQYRSGTCWSFSGVGFFETELLRMGKPEVDLSPMFVVRMAYADKAEKYVRMHGALNFGGGGSFYDVWDVMKRYGIVPMEVYQGLNYGEEKHVHGELDALTEAYVKAMVKNPNRKLSSAWLKGFNGIMDAYLGAVPENFTYKGKSYTPKSFAESLGLKLDDYVCISSYTHHPFYTEFIIEVPDNWQLATVHNVPMHEMMQIIDNAIDNGYPIAWASDVSEGGFSWRHGVAIVPDMESQELQGSDMARWTKMTAQEKNEKAFEKPGKELTITQEMRQAEFDNFQTTDDHGMVLVGAAKDQEGNIYYKVKNSWGVDGKYNGYFYASKAFVQYKTMSIMVHKDAIPKAIRQKMKL
ncbi:MAG: aminopeptidase [Bacteroidales bacterium]|nr:aminopeptidase [Bacteroidales bacterium]